MRRPLAAVASTWLCLSLLAGCSAPPTTPTPPPPTALPAPPPLPQATFRLSGTVYEHTRSGVRPLPGVRLDISQPVTSRNARHTTDSAGRYEVRSAGALKVNVENFDLLQPCRAAIMLTEDSTLDVHVVPVEVAKTSGIPPSLSVVQPTLAGRVIERTTDGIRAVPEALVTLDFSGGDGWDPGATFLSDALGHYVFCNIAAGAPLGLAVQAEKWGYRNSYVLIGYPNESTVLDIELVRR